MLSAVEQALNHYVFQLRRALSGRLLGDHTYIQPGDGYEIRNTRPYESGDSFRDIDHKLSAKLGEPHVRQMFADREVDIWLLLDVRRAMRLGSPASKFHQALHLMMMGYAWTHGTVSRVGAIRLGAPGGVSVAVNGRPARQGRAYALDVLEWLRTSPRPEQSANQPIAEALAESFDVIRSPATVFIATDLDNPAVIQPLENLSHRHEVTVFGTRDRIDDLTLPLSGWVNLEDADSGIQETGYISRSKREKAADDIATQLEVTEDQLGRLPLAYLKVGTEDNSFEKFVGYARSYRFLERRRSA